MWLFTSCGIEHTSTSTRSREAQKAPLGCTRHCATSFPERTTVDVCGAGRGFKRWSTSVSCRVSQAGWWGAGWAEMQDAVPPPCGNVTMARGRSCPWQWIHQNTTAMNCPLWALGQFQRQVKPQDGNELTRRQPDQLPRHACRQYSHVRSSDQKCLIQLNPSGIVLTASADISTNIWRQAGSNIFCSVECCCLPTMNLFDHRDSDKVHVLTMYGWNFLASVNIWHFCQSSWTVGSKPKPGPRNPSRRMWRNLTKCSRNQWPKLDSRLRRWPSNSWSHKPT